SGQRREGEEPFKYWFLTPLSFLISRSEVHLCVTSVFPKTGVASTRLGHLGGAPDISQWLSPFVRLVRGSPFVRPHNLVHHTAPIRRSIGLGRSAVSSSHHLLFACSAVHAC